MKTKKSLELLSEMSECQGNPSWGLSKKQLFQQSEIGGNATY
ncbi:hypothetical protein CAAU_0717 [Caloramator australicus RC3]|uniref:Uncharacterized protein n=1 Tax=Caloramator australicus RC3 TaxID=857293 RepID=I7J4P0_9CLOT|nr:hypothetical protein CAAU_0717 [Caloramator australicus RC3]